MGDTIKGATGLRYDDSETLIRGGTFPDGVVPLLTVGMMPERSIITSRISLESLPLVIEVNVRSNDRAGSYEAERYERGINNGPDMKRDSMSDLGIPPTMGRVMEKEVYEVDRVEGVTS